MTRRRHESVRVEFTPAEHGSAEAARKSFLHGVVIEPAPETPAAEAKPALSKSALALKISAAMHPEHTLVEHYRSIGVSPAKGKAAVDELVAGGYARVRRIRRTGSGAQYQVLELLPAADAILQTAGLSRPAPKVKGGFKHDLFARYTAKWAERERAGHPEFEKTYGRKTFDVSWIEPCGSVWGAEICLSGGPGRTAEQLLKALRPTGMNVLAVFESRKAMDAALKALKADARFAAVEERFEARLVGEFIRILFERG